MAQFNHGVNGAFSGKVGSVIGSSWRDIDYMRGLPKKSSKEATTKQLAVRARFRVLSQFLLLIKDAVDRGYPKQYTGRATAFNLALQANQAAITGTDLDPQLDYSKIVISRGHTLTKPFDCKLAEGVQGHVMVSWQMFSGASVERMEDKVVIALCCPEKQEAVVSLDDFVRQDGVADLEVPANWSSTTVYGYLFVTSKEGASSATVYAGSLPLL